MPLILKAGGNRIYMRGGNGAAKTQLYGVQEWSYVKDRAETANLFSFGFPEPCLLDGSRYIPAVRDEIFIYKSEADYTADTRWFGGLLTSVNDAIIQCAGSGYIAGYRLEAQSFDILLDKELRQTQKAGLTWKELLEFLLTSHFSTQLSTDYSLIANPISAPPIRINNGNLRTLLKAMRQLTNHDYFVDVYKRLNVFEVASIPGSFAVNDQPMSGITVWDERPTIAHEGRAIYNIVRQPYQNYVTLDEWPGESFTGKGDPTGQGGRLPLLRTPSTIEETTYLEDKFDGAVFDSNLWIEADTTTTQHPDYPNQGYLFPAEGQLQVLGGTYSLGDIALVSQEFFPYVESSYIVQEIQLTSLAGEGFIALFTDGASNHSTHFKAGFLLDWGELKSVGSYTTLATLQLNVNYILWVTMTPDGWQYDIQGGEFATKQRLLTVTGVTHLTDYKISPIINADAALSINSFRYRQSDRGITLSINGEKKVVGLEASDADLPDIDAFLNVDETPALIKFRAARDISVIASVASATQFTATTGHGSKFQPGQRLLVGDNIVEAFNGKAGIVASVAGDVVTLVSPGITGMTTGKQILIDTTVPAKDDKIVVKYGYSRWDEAVAYDKNSVDKYGPLPITLDEKDHIKRFDDAQAEAENFLTRYKDGILTISFASNHKLIPLEPEPMTAIAVKLTKRPDPIERTLVLQRVEIKELGGLGRSYALQLESADPVKPLEDLFRGRSLVIGADGAIRFSVNLTDEQVCQDELAIRAASSLYITWANPENRRYGEFKWKP
jgi:hypothetical protein